METHELDANIVTHIKVLNELYSHYERFFDGLLIKRARHEAFFRDLTSFRQPNIALFSTLEIDRHTENALDNFSCLASPNPGQEPACYEEAASRQNGAPLNVYQMTTGKTLRICIRCFYQSSARWDFACSPNLNKGPQIGWPKKTSKPQSLGTCEKAAENALVFFFFFRLSCQALPRYWAFLTLHFPLSSHPPPSAAPHFILSQATYLAPQLCEPKRIVPIYTMGHGSRYKWDSLPIGRTLPLLKSSVSFPKFRPQVMDRPSLKPHPVSSPTLDYSRFPRRGVGKVGWCPPNHKPKTTKGLHGPRSPRTGTWLVTTSVTRVGSGRMWLTAYSRALWASRCQSRARRLRNLDRLDSPHNQEDARDHRSDMEMVVPKLQHPGSAADGLLHHRANETGAACPFIHPRLMTCPYLLVSLAYQWADARRPRRQSPSRRKDTLSGEDLGILLQWHWKYGHGYLRKRAPEGANEPAHTLFCLHRQSASYAARGR